MDTRTESKYTSEVQAPSWPIFASFGPTVTPGVSAGTRNTAMPGPFSSAGRVRAKTTNRSANGAFVMKRFWPSITQSSPSRLAVVRSPAGLDPAPDSVRANDATTSPEAILSSHCLRCTSVPNFTRTCPAMPLLVPNIERSASEV